MAEELVELAQRCLAGDERALREFVEQFQSQVFALCMRMLGHRQDAEDTTQESLVRAVKYLKSWDPSLPLRPWVLKIAANRCRTALAQRTRIPTPVEEIYESCTTEPQEEHGLEEGLSRALETLKAEHRHCFVLFYEQELSIQDIAEVMGVPIGTVKTWLHRSRKQLAEALQRRGFRPET